MGVYRKNVRILNDNNPELGILAVFIIFFINFTTPAIAAITTSGVDSSQIYLSLYLSDDDIKYLENFLFSADPSQMQFDIDRKGCIHESGKLSPVNCADFSGHIKTGGSRAITSFNRGDHTSSLNSRIKTYRSISSMFFSHGSGGYL